MTSLSGDSERKLDRAALVLRVVLGAVFVAHGYQKLFGMGIPGATTMFTQIGAPMPALTAPAVAVLEFAGGLALFVGAFTRVAAILLACDMLGAMIFVHAKNGFFAPKGIELTLGNFAMLIAIAVLGAGVYSLDAMMAKRGAHTP